MMKELLMKEWNNETVFTKEEYLAEIIDQIKKMDFSEHNKEIIDNQQRINII